MNTMELGENNLQVMKRYKELMSEHYEELVVYSAEICIMFHYNTDIYMYIQQNINSPHWKSKYIVATTQHANHKRMLHYCHFCSIMIIMCYIQLPAFPEMDFILFQKLLHNSSRWECSW